MHEQFFLPKKFPMWIPPQCSLFLINSFTFFHHLFIHLVGSTLPFTTMFKLVIALGAAAAALQVSAQTATTVAAPTLPTLPTLPDLTAAVPTTATTAVTCQTGTSACTINSNLQVCVDTSVVACVALADGTSSIVCPAAQAKACEITNIGPVCYDSTSVQCLNGALADSAGTTVFPVATTAAAPTLPTAPTTAPTVPTLPTTLPTLPTAGSTVTDPITGQTITIPAAPTLPTAATAAAATTTTAA